MALVRIVFENIMMSSIQLFFSVTRDSGFIFPGYNEYLHILLGAFFIVRAVDFVEDSYFIDAFKMLVFKLYGILDVATLLYGKLICIIYNTGLWITSF